MTSRTLTRRRIALAFVIAILADILQLPVSLSLVTGFVPAEALDAAIDVLTAAVINWPSGFIGRSCRALHSS